MPTCWRPAPLQSACLYLEGCLQPHSLLFSSIRQCPLLASSSALLLRPRNRMSGKIADPFFPTPRWLVFSHPLTPFAPFPILGTCPIFSSPILIVSYDTWDFSSPSLFLLLLPHPSPSLPTTFLSLVCFSWCAFFLSTVLTFFFSWLSAFAGPSLSGHSGCAIQSF